MQKTSLVILILLISISLLGCMNGGDGAPQKQEGKPKEQVQDSSKSDELIVKGLVEDFGSRLQKVSLQGPEEVIEKSMQEEYGDFVSPALIKQWLNKPLNAPGRLTSSPWPERIEILSIKKLSEARYEVTGEVIEVTSVEKENDGVAARRPITLVVEKIEDSWLINSTNLGEYVDDNSIVYSNSEYGFSFNLPENWADYSIVTDQWKGLAIGSSPDSQVVETGPMISIRHPKWTSEEQRQDIPIMIFTLGQWKSLEEEEEFHIGAAPIKPKELTRNNKYVFALPARYNYAFPTGYEEVVKILESNPLQVNKKID
ncbi:MAG: hypothetical protein JM58_06050 [Peptococcaceae bacterium BICA1-8]|nr:MAG: hypothetical protein JM58_06050 [Peptococcaceae bacterium BICA1-8]